MDCVLPSIHIMKALSNTGSRTAVALKVPLQESPAGYILVLFDDITCDILKYSCAGQFFIAYQDLLLLSGALSGISGCSLCCRGE